MSIPAVFDSGCFGESFKYLNRKGDAGLQILPEEITPSPINLQATIQVTPAEISEQFLT